MHRELVERAQRGDAEAFDALARLVGDRCMAIACRILRDVDLADEAVQAALIAAWRDLRSLRDPDRFEAWLHRILTNECYAEARRRRRWSADLTILHAEPTTDAGDYHAVVDRDQLDRAFRRLTLEQRAILVFHFYLDLPLTDVADRVGVPLGTASPGSTTPSTRFEPVSMRMNASPRSERSDRHDRTARRRPTPSDYLDTGPTQLPDRSFDAVREAIDDTRQRVVIGPWRTPCPHMPDSPRPLPRWRSWRSSA